MAKKRQSIVPFEKKAPATSIDKIPETATIEDYEKIVSKMAKSSDTIIDNMLDKLEGKPVTNTVQAESQNPVEPPPPVDSQEEGLPGSDKPAEEPIQEDVQPTDESCNLGEPVPHCDDPFMAELIRKNDELRKKIETYEYEIKSLKQKLESTAENGAIPVPFTEEMNKLVEKNDDLILRNSELEFEISRLGAENKRLKQQLEQSAATKRLPPQTYSREAYTRVNRPIMGQRPIVPPRRGQNGYESWN